MKYVLKKIIMPNTIIEMIEYFDSMKEMTTFLNRHYRKRIDIEYIELD